MREPERIAYERMKRSPYRDYLDGENYSPDEIVYIKVLDEDSNIAQVEYHLYKSMPKGKLRAVIRKQAGAPGVSGLYIYAHTATMEQAKKRLMTMLHEEDETLIPTDVRLTEPYRNEQDAMHVLYALGNLYEPVRLFRHLRRKKKADEPDGNRGTPS